MGNDRARIAELTELHQRAEVSLLSGVPMNWMTRWPGAFPVFVASASGAEVTPTSTTASTPDLCLGDTGAMTGHSPPPTVAAVTGRLASGITAMLPTEDAISVGEEMQRRFGLRNWQFSLSATDANRFVIRSARQITGRSKVLVHNHCYHGTVDETFATLIDGRVGERGGNIGAPVDPAETTRVVEINDLGALERELAHGDVACVLVEPALTNIGIVLAEPGYHDGLRELTRAAGTLLVIDETHPVLRTRRLHGGPRARPGFPHDRQGDRRRGTDRCPGRPPRPRLRRGNRRADEMMPALPRGRATR